MILVDTSVWIDHLRSGNGTLVTLLNASGVAAHPCVVGELALGNLRDRDELLALLRDLPRAVVAEQDEVLRLIADERLHSQAIGYVDAQLLAAARLTPDTVLWTEDRPLATAARRLRIGFTPPTGASG